MKNQTTKWSIRFPYRIDTLARHPTENIFAFGSGRLLTIAEISNDKFVYQDFLSHSVSSRVPSMAHFRPGFMVFKLNMTEKMINSEIDPRDTIRLKRKNFNCLRKPIYVLDLELTFIFLLKVFYFLFIKFILLF